MERLTFDGNFCDIAKCDSTPGGTFCETGTCTQRCVWERLKEYEDTGLEPEEIADFMKRWERAVEIAGLCKKGGIDHLLELKKAEQDGQLVVLPCKVGDTVYVIGEKRIMRCNTDGAYLDDKKGPEFLVSFDCDGDCDGCPFNIWNQDYSGEYFCSGEYGQDVIVGADFGKTVFLTREEAEAALAQEGGTHEDTGGL
ncbi:MAG: hypothetical protein SOZ47_00265 [Lawsonibacter sp.]|nr:hypothetical protein [Lawsonibacter sp.]